MRARIYLVIFVFPAVALLSGCASLGLGGEKSASARGYPVMVLGRSEFSTFYGAAVNGRTNYVYVVKDGKGRESVVMSKRDDLIPGNCATLWRDISSPYYPRLSRATENCAPLSGEPDEIGGYLYVRENYLNRRYPYVAYRLSLDNWLDVPGKDVIRVLGEPSHKEEKDGKVFLTYSKQITLDVYEHKSWMVVSALDNLFTSENCFTTFEIRDGIVFNYSLREKGKGCH